ncbi:hypothetical protein DTO012A7_1007 [Penicillium roqueforti]|nr:hypothetical protein CBS147372_3775 [Penicillium roqueforti]KAI3245028.1 hypothetical protein DTO012A7_1007 [Penicillium roqueforti]KAI3276940.1 hypothetical protein CBS147309_2922 [Penicillium roqueforti]
MKDAILDLHSKTQKLSFTQLKAYIENLTSIFEEGQFERPTIVISSLNIGDVQVLLKLTHSLDNLEFCNRTPVELSPVCAEWMDMTRDAFGKSGPNEALTRITLNNLLIFAHHFVTSQPSTTSSDMNMNDLNLNAEGLWRYGPVMHKDTKHDLVGRPDYSLWYGNEEDVAVSVVVVETKGVESVTSGVSQTLGYMGCVHRRRKDLQKKDATVYGVVSDGQCWWFLKINNDSEWSEYIITARHGNYQEVVGILVHMFRTAATMSPAQSEGTSLQTHSKEASAESYMEFDEEAVEDDDEEEF